MKIPTKYIIEIGLMRKRNVCAKCGNKMNVPNHNIQLCRNCRIDELNNYANKQLNEN